MAGASLLELSALADKSLLALTASGLYQIHELLRQYAEEKLLASNRAVSARDDHCHYYLRRMNELEVDVKGGRQRQGLDEIALDLENVRAAWDWALNRKDYASIDQTLVTLFYFANTRGRFHEGEALLRQAEEALAASPDQASDFILSQVYVYRRLLRAFYLQEQHPEAPPSRVEESLVAARASDDTRKKAFALASLGSLAFEAGRFGQAVAYYREGLVLYRQLDDFFDVSELLQFIGLCLLQMGRFDEAIDQFRQSLEAHRELGDNDGMAHSLHTLGATHLAAGHYAEAESYHRQANDIFREIGHRFHYALGTESLAFARFLQGDFRDSAALANEALAIADDLNASSLQGYGRLIVGLLASMEGDYVQALRFCQDSRRLFRQTANLSRADWGLAIASCGMDRYAEAKVQIGAALHYAAANLQSRAMTTWCLPVAALVVAEADELERAVELLGLAFGHPAAAIGWMERWLLLASQRELFEAHLGPAAFKALWDRGAGLDLQTTAYDILAYLDSAPEVTAVALAMARS